LNYFRRLTEENSVKELGKEKLDVDDKADRDRVGSTVFGPET